MGEVCYSYVYPPEIATEMHISQLEALNCLIAARHFANDIRDECIQILCDNEPAVCSLSSGKGRDTTLLAICRAFWYFAAARNIKFIFSHIPESEMDTADALSRAHLSKGDEEKALRIIREKGLVLSCVNPAECDIHSYF